jgi:hypothetical protein
LFFLPLFFNSELAKPLHFEYRCLPGLELPTLRFSANPTRNPKPTELSFGGPKGKLDWPQAHAGDLRAIFAIDLPMDHVFVLFSCFILTVPFPHFFSPVA